jgi:succinate-semialdehyde dehydrogenase/glutarate-semialdehyde dehydrogenase
MGTLTYENSTTKGPGNEAKNETTGRRTIRSYAPASGHLLGEVPASTRDDVFAAVARARRAQLAWGALPVAERCHRLLRFRDALVHHAEDLVDIIARECGKPRPEALLHEIMPTADLATYYCAQAPRILAPEQLSFHLMKHRGGTVHYLPRGVIGVISPWNFPYVIPMGDVFAALVSGSAVVVKPSEVTPLTLLKAKEIYNTTGLPEDLFMVVPGYGDAGAALIEAGIQKLVFTGGVETGRRVAAACGQHLVPCVLELGGKSPCIVCEDADLERAARGIVFGGFANSGQVCISVERVYAHASIHDALVKRIRELVADLRQGDPIGPTIDVGAIIFPKQITVAEAHIEDAVAKGATVVIGGKKKSGTGQFFEPTVIAECNHSMTVMREEIFGPIVAIQKVSSDDEAVNLANDSHLGLNAYVFTKDRARGEQLALRIQAGSVLVNDVLANHATAEAPFGGIKQSGYGRVHGDDALRDMSERRHINVDRIPMPAQDPLWYPYGEKSYGLFLRSLKAIFGGGTFGKRLRDLI